MSQPDSRSIWHGARVLVTGGTGSFGRQFVAQVLPQGPMRVRVFSRDEHKQAAMAEEYSAEPRLQFQLGDVRDLSSVKRAVRGIDVVVQAAALKIVPGCERHVEEAVRTNFAGARNVLQAIRSSSVQRLVVLGSDKAVEPVNVMGMTKALQERLVTSLQPELDAVVTVVRYGNVFGSRSSVVEQFCQRARAGLPIRVTDPEMTRFFLGLDEACRMILDYGERACGGEVFVPRLRSIRLGRLAEIIQEIFGSKAPVEVTGARPGEKWHETLVSRHEAHRTRVTENEFIVLPSCPMPERHAAYAPLRLCEEPFDSLHATPLEAEDVLCMLQSGGILP